MSNCILSNRVIENGKMTCLCTCLKCGHSMRVPLKGWNIIKCISCKTDLNKGPYLNQEKFKEEVSSMKKDLQQRLEATSNTVLNGFSPAAPFTSYREAQKKLRKISALPKKQKK